MGELIFLGTYTLESLCGVWCRVFIFHSYTKDLTPLEFQLSVVQAGGLREALYFILLPLPHPAYQLKPKLQDIWVQEMSLGQKPTSVFLFSFLGSFLSLLSFLP